MVQLVRYDRQGSKDMLFTLLAICSFAKVAYAATDQIAQPWLVEFGTTSGPDGMCDRLLFDSNSKTQLRTMERHYPDCVLAHSGTSLFRLSSLTVLIRVL